MNKANKIFLVIIVVLIIALGGMTYLYFNMRKQAIENLNAYLNAANVIYDLTQNGEEE